MSARLATIVVAISLAGLLFFAVPAAAQNSGGPHSTYPVQLTAPTVGNSPPPPHTPGPPEEKPRHHPHLKSGSGDVADPVVQTSTPAPAAAVSQGQWEGLGAGYPGFTITAVPPDPNLAVGPNHIVQWVNNAVVVFDKHGNQVQAPVADSTFWGGTFSTCNQLGGFTDPVVQYDRAADRWIVGEVALPLFPGLFGQYAQCFAVSKTSNPTFVSDANGNNTSYYMWTYGFGNTVNDYDKIAVWSDGYYVTWNMFPNGATFAGPEACAWSRTDMLAGVSAPRFVCFQLSNAYASLLPSDLDGPASPPAGSPNFFMAIDPDSGALQLWKFHADFVTQANSTFTGPTSIPGVAPFTAPCPATQDCIPQPGTTEHLDAIGDRLLHRLAYHNFGDHESIVANHTVLTAGGNTGVRWYEVRNPNTAPVIYQQGTFAPDSDSRWMASVAMDKTGNIGLGYSVSSAATYPSIRYTGWEVGNQLGILQAETSLAMGFGSQTGYNRWGDYSAMRIDPSDDCTFWYTQEYQTTTDTVAWNTRVGSFKFPNCGSVAPPVLTTITVSPASASVQTGASFQFSATAFDQFGNPMNPQPTFTWSVNGGGTINSSGLFTAGAAAGGPFTVTAVSGGVNGTASVTVTSPPPDFSLLVSPPSQSVRRGNTATYTVTITPINGFNGPVTLSLTGQPSGSTVTFTPNPATTTSTLTVRTSRTSAAKAYTLTIKGVNGGLNHTTTASLTVTK